jgi:hypothetical protein
MFSSHHIAAQIARNNERDRIASARSSRLAESIRRLSAGGAPASAADPQPHADDVRAQPAPASTPARPAACEPPVRLHRRMPARMPERLLDGRSRVRVGGRSQR